ncbi:MAG: ARPP-1 family domain-containing protein, partial [Planctomycetota bacterium]
NQPGQRSVLGYVSPTSLQLTLESKKVKEAAEKYTKALAGVVEGRDDVVGFAFAINGEANSADLYASRALFRKLWPKLLKAAAVEAVAELKKDEENKKVAHPAAGYLVAEFFTKLDEEGEKVAVSEKEITKRVRMKTKESDEVILFEMFDTAKPAAEARLHINVIKK